MCKHDGQVDKGALRIMKSEKSQVHSATYHQSSYHPRRSNNRSRGNIENSGQGFEQQSQKSDQKKVHPAGRKQGENRRRPASLTPTKGMGYISNHTQRSAPATPSPNVQARSVSRSPIDNNASLAYAGARFSDPPSPKVLPKPPSHWFSFEDIPTVAPNKACSEMTNVLKLMLNVQA